MITPVCPECGADCRREVYHEDGAKVDQWHCLNCGWIDFTDDAEDAAHDIRAYDLLESAGLIEPLPDAFTRLMRLSRRWQTRKLELFYNPMRGYVAQEVKNGLEE